MRRLFCCLAAAMLLGGSCAMAQESNSSGSGQATAPGSGGHSKPGVAGKPGSKSGTTMTPNGNAPGDSEQQAQRRSQDESGVRGRSGSESGETVAPNPKSKSH